MKPSERIEELFNQEPYWSNLPKAIIQYLDETWEAEQCNHPVTGEISNTICKKCGRSFYTNLKTHNGNDK